MANSTFKNVMMASQLKEIRQDDIDIIPSKSKPGEVFFLCGYTGEVDDQGRPKREAGAVSKELKEKVLNNEDIDLSRVCYAEVEQEGKEPVPVLFCLPKHILKRF